ncbi:MAG: hypothetical protein V2J07_04900 [Anaerolineae bacterium]|nr:hypothetical protein [Anaerolineae bacterium]
MEDKALFWENLLSRDPEKVKAAWQMLPIEYRKDVRDHLVSMVTELDWHPEQVKSAEAALDVIDTMGVDH